MMREVVGTIEHRLLLNWAADPAVIAPLLPPPFRPKLVGDRAVVGICVLRLGDLRPRGLPARLGITTDNAAHRIAVEWDGPDSVETGVHVLRRDTAQWLPALVGGRLFPGVHGRARFDVRDREGVLHVAYRAADGLAVDAAAVPATAWSSRLFATVDDAVTFFGGGDRGYSPGRRGDLDGVALVTPAWQPQLVEVTATASFYDDPRRFPSGSIELDGALLLRDLPVTWRRVPSPVGGVVRPDRCADAPNVGSAAGWGQGSPDPVG